MARRRALLTLLLMVVIPLAVGAQSKTTYRVGIVMLDPKLEGLADVAAASATAYGSTLYLTDLEQQAMLQEFQDSLEQERLASLHAAYQAQDAKKLAASLQMEQTDFPEVPKTLRCEYVRTDYDSKVSELLRLDEQALQWYRKREQFDALLLLQSQKLGDLERVRIEFASHSRTLLLDTLVQYGSYQSLNEILDTQIFKYMSSSLLSALVLENGGTAFSVYIDDAKKAVTDSPLFLVKGEHVLLITAPGYESQQLVINLEGGQIRRFSFALAKVKHPDLHLQSESGIVHWFVNGRDMGTALSISLADPTYPLVLNATKEGFANRLVLLDKPTSSLHLTLNPAFLSDEAILVDSQKDFYKRLRNTILLFGAYVGCTALSQTFESTNPLWQVGMVGTSSLALVSAVALVMELASYADRAGSSL